MTVLAMAVCMFSLRPTAPEESSFVEGMAASDAIDRI